MSIITSTCDGCSLQKKVSGSLPANGGPVDVLFAVYTPSWEDDKEGVIFGSNHGQVVTAFADKCNFSYAAGYVVGCRPTDDSGKSRLPTPKELSRCEKNIHKAIASLTPKVIVMVGEPATKYFLEGAVDDKIIKGKVSVGKMRGKVFGDGITKRVCIYSPSYYLREGGPGVEILKEHYCQDFQLIESLVEGTYVEKKATTVYITDYSDLLDLVNTVRNHSGLVSVDFEVNTNEKDPDTASLYKDKTKALSVGISIDGITGYCIPLNHKQSPFINRDIPIAKMLEGKTLLSHNVMYEIQCMDRFYNIDPRTISFEDSLILAYIINPDDVAGRDLKTLTNLYTPFGGYEKDLHLYYDKLPLKDKNFGSIPLDILAPYNACDAVCAYRVYDALLDKAKTLGRLGLYEWMKDKVAMLAVMTHNGILFNYPVHKKIKENLDTAIWRIHTMLMQHEAIQHACSLANTDDFNVKSTPHKQKLLFETLSLSPVKKTKAGQYSADSETFENYNNIPVVAGVVAEMKCRDALSKYIGPLDTYICEDGSGHPLFNIAKTVTGRLSSNAFSIQIIPRNPDMRDMFRAEEGFKLVSIDMGQAELRVLATIAEERVMIKAFHNGEDIHQATGNMVGISRQDAKVVNFGIIYGMSSRGLANDLGINELVAKDIITKYLETYPGIARYTNIVRSMVYNSQPIHTPFGRVRLFKFVGNSESSYEAACRSAVNYPIQSVASDIMLAIGEKICRKYGYRLHKVLGYKDTVLSGEFLKVVPHALIHDEIICSVADKWVEDYKLIGVEIAQTIELPFKMRVPVVADASSGNTWGDLSRAHK